jgi:hypothetical protein
MYLVVMGHMNQKLEYGLREMSTDQAVEMRFLQNMRNKQEGLKHENQDMR